MKRKLVYLDNASNTPLDKQVFEAMRPFLKENFVGNTHSIHEFGIRARNAIEKARDQIAEATGFNRDEIYFTSGATESNNWVLKSLAFHELFEEKKPKKHIVVSAIEHASILNTCKQLEKMGFSITYVKPEPNGHISINKVHKAMRYNTLLVCVMAANNETGVVNAVSLIGALAHANKSLMMSDCTQFLSYGGKDFYLKNSLRDVDYCTFSGHKIYGPTGTGCLIASKSAPLYPFITGGAQENALRGGTSNTAGIVGLGKAIEIWSKNNYKEHYKDLYFYLLSELNKYEIPYKLNCRRSLYNIVNINFSQFMHDSELASLLATYGIACSASSACEAGGSGADGILTVPSHVLSAMGIPETEINNSVRLSFSKYTKRSDIDTFVKVIKQLKEKS